MFFRQANMKHTYLLYTFALLAAMVLPACSDDDATSSLVPEVPGKEEAAKRVDVKVNLSTRTMGGVKTRADEQGKLILDPSNTEVDLNGTPNERINKWFMIVVHADDKYVGKKGKIAQIIHRDGEGVISDADKTKPVFRENFNLSLKPGKYHVYTFGNIGYETFLKALGTHVGHNDPTTYTLGEGHTMPDIEDFAWEEFHNQVISESVHIPLSSVDSDLEVDVETSVEIELERVVGKLQFYFANHTSSDLTIKRFELMPIRTKTYLLEHVKEGGLVATPPHVHNNANETITRCDDSSKDITENSWGGFSIAKQSASSNVFNKCSALGFYVNESVPEISDAYPLGHFKLKLLLDRNGVEEVRSSMLHNLTAIERNQWYMQPIMFTDWVLQPEIHYYPPIGGYPVVQIEENSKFEECYSTFKDVTKDSPFQIRLRLHDGDMKWYDITDKSVVNGKVEVGGSAREQPYFIRVTDPDGVLNHSTLSLNSGLITSPDGQLTGHFTGNAGRAIISVYANIEIKSGVHYTYERDLYVIVKKTNS